MNENKGLVSVIVPVYQSAETLPKCIRSILRQTYDRLEILLIDDGSQDKSGAICDRYAMRPASQDTSIKVIHQPNGGVSSARNAGLDAASGEYVTFVDADDWLPTKAVESMVRQMAEYDADICFGSYTTVSASGKRKISVGESDSFSKGQNRDSYLSLIRKIKFMPAVCGKLLRNELIRKNGLRFRSGVKLGEDTIFIWEYLRWCECISIAADSVYFYSLITRSSASRRYYPEHHQWIFLTVSAFLQMTANECEHDAAFRREAADVIFSGFIGVCGQYAGQLGRMEALQKIEETNALFAELLQSVLELISNGRASVNDFSRKEYIACLESARERRYGEIYDWLYTRPSYGRKLGNALRSFVCAVKRLFCYGMGF